MDVRREGFTYCDDNDVVQGKPGVDIRIRTLRIRTGRVRRISPQGDDLIAGLKVDEIIKQKMYFGT